VLSRRIDPTKPQKRPLPALIDRRCPTSPTEPFAGNLTEAPELWHSEGGIAQATFRVAVSGRRDGEPSFFTVVAWRDQAEHAAESLTKGSRVTHREALLGGGYSA
jgi:hypothetical protein